MTTLEDLFKYASNFRVDFTIEFKNSNNLFALGTAIITVSKDTGKEVNVHKYTITPEFFKHEPKVLIAHIKQMLEYAVTFGKEL